MLLPGKLISVNDVWINLYDYKIRLSQASTKTIWGCTVMDRRVQCKLGNCTDVGFINRMSCFRKYLQIKSASSLLLLGTTGTSNFGWVQLTSSPDYYHMDYHDFSKIFDVLLILLKTQNFNKSTRNCRFHKEHRLK